MNPFIMKHKKFLLVAIIVALFLIIVLPFIIGTTKQRMLDQAVTQVFNAARFQPSEEVNQAIARTEEAALKLGRELGVDFPTDQPHSYILERKDIGNKLPFYILSVEYDEVFGSINIVLKLEQKSWEEFYALQKQAAPALRAYGIEPCEIYLQWIPEGGPKQEFTARPIPDSIVYFCLEQGYPK